MSDTIAITPWTRFPRPLLRASNDATFSAAPAQPATVPVLELGGFHGYLEPYTTPTTAEKGLIGGAAALTAVIEQEKARTGQALVISGGDFFQGPPLATVFKGKPVIEFMNQAGFDCMTLGNHDFELGVAELASRLGEAHFPALAANLLDARSGRPVWQTDNALHMVRPYHVATVGGARVAVVGLMKPETPLLTAPEFVQGLAWKSIEQTLRDVLPALVSDERPDVIVLHCQQIQLSDSILAQAHQVLGKCCPDDPPALMFVGGHNDPNHAQPMLTSDGLIVQGTERGESLNATRLTVDVQRHKIIQVQHTDIPVIDSQVQPDPTVAGIVERYKQRLGGHFSARVGEAAVALTRSRHQDGPLGSLVTQAMREHTKADVAFLTGGTLKSDLLAGPLTYGQLYEVDPFDNHCVSFDMTGSQLQAVMEKSASRPSGDKVLQMSGATLVYDSARPVGQRVIAATIDGKPIEPARVYRVAIDDFLAAGGDFYSEFKIGGTVSKGPLVRDIFADFTRHHSPLRAVSDDRIRDVAEH